MQFVDVVDAAGIVVVLDFVVYFVELAEFVGAIAVVVAAPLPVTECAYFVVVAVDAAIFVFVLSAVAVVAAAAAAAVVVVADGVLLADSSLAVGLIVVVVVDAPYSTHVVLNPKAVALCWVLLLLRCLLTVKTVEIAISDCIHQ